MSTLGPTGMAVARPAGHRPETVGERAQSGGGQRPPTVSLRIGLLGEVRVEVGGVAVPASAWRLRKARALIELLALARGHRQRRERAAALLWPELRAADRPNNLRTTLHAARRALESAAAGGGAWLAADREWIWLAKREGLWIDVEALEAAAAAAREADDPERCWAALGLYGGDLVFSEQHEDGMRRRAWLREAYVGLLTRAAELHERRGEFARAADALRRLVATEPASEAAHLGLMRLYALAGDRHGAVRQFHLLREALRRLGTEPRRATVELFEQVLEWQFAWSVPAVRGLSAAGVGPGAQLPARPHRPESDGAWRTVVAVAHRPIALAAHAAAGLLFVAHFGGREVWAIDMETLEVRAKTETGDSPHGVAVNPVTDRVYVASYGGQRVTMLDARTGEWLRHTRVERGRFPRGVAVDPVTNRVYVTTRRNGPSDDRAADALLVLDGETLACLAVVPVGEMPMGVAVDVGARHVYVANGWSNTVTAVDGARDEAVGEVPVGGYPFLLALDGERGRLYAANQDDGTLSAIACAEAAVVATVRVGKAPYGMAIDPRRNRIYVGNSGDGTVGVVDGAAHVLLDTVPVGGRPSELALDPAGDRLFVANAEGNALTVLDVSGLAGQARQER